MEQVDAIMGGGPTAAVVFYHPVRSPQPERVSNIVVLREIGVDESCWKPLPILSRIGLDLLYVTKDDCEHHLLNMDEYPNQMFEVLTTDCDPESEGFGQPGQKLMGGVVFKFRDDVGNQLWRSALDCVEEFIVWRLTGIKLAVERKDMAYTKQVYEKINPIEYKKFFKLYRATQAEKGQMPEWLTTPCAARIEVDHCEACGVEAGSGSAGVDKKVLMKCARCKGVMYCGRECQAGDWKAHTPFCGRK